MERLPISSEIPKTIEQGTDDFNNSMDKGPDSVKYLTSKQGREAFLANLQKGLDSLEIQHIGKIYERIKSENDIGVRSGLIESLHNKYGEKIDEYHNLHRSNNDYLKYGNISLYGSDANTLLESLAKESANSKAIAETRLFINPQILALETMNGNEPSTKIIINTNKPIKIPRGMFISAEGFENWRGRPEGVLKDGRNSSEVIDEYASLDSKAPAVESAEGYMLPDGRLYIKSENSHRVAAALKRGDEFIDFNGSLIIHVLNNVPDSLGS